MGVIEDHDAGLVRAFTGSYGDFFDPNAKIIFSRGLLAGFLPEFFADQRRGGRRAGCD